MNANLYPNECGVHAGTTELPFSEGSEDTACADGKAIRHLETTVVDACGGIGRQEHQRLLAQHKRQKIFLVMDAVLSQAGGEHRTPPHTSEAHGSHIHALRF